MQQSAPMPPHQCCLASITSCLLCTYCWLHKPEYIEKGSKLLVQAVLSALSNELLCVNTELRLMYDAYSGREAWGWGRSQHSAALTAAQFWLLMRECSVPEPDCCLAHINMALAQVSLLLCGPRHKTVESRKGCEHASNPRILLCLVALHHS